MAAPDEIVVTAEIAYEPIAVPGTVAWRFVSTHAVRWVVGEDERIFDPRIDKAARPTIVREITRPFTRPVFGVAELVIDNSDGALDDWRYDFFEGHVIWLKVGQIDDPFGVATYRVVWAGQTEEIRWDVDRVVLRLIDNMVSMDKRVSEDRFTADGETPLLGQYKTAALGTVAAIPLRHVYTDHTPGSGSNLYQYSAAPASDPGFNTLWDNGIYVNPATYDFREWDDSGFVWLYAEGSITEPAFDNPEDVNLSANCQGLSLEYFTDNDGTLTTGPVSVFWTMVSAMFRKGEFVPIDDPGGELFKRFDVASLKTLSCSFMDIGIVVEDGGNILDLLDNIFPPYAFWYQSIDGTIYFGEVPRNWITQVRDATPDWSVKASMIERDSLTITRSQAAPATDTSVMYNRHWSQHTRTVNRTRQRKDKDGNVYRDQVKLTQDVADHRLMRVGLGEAQPHAHAASSEALEGYMWAESDAQSMATRFLELYWAKYNIYEFRVRLETVDEQNFPGDVSDVFNLRYYHGGQEINLNLWCTRIGLELGGDYVRVQGIERWPDHLPVTQVLTP